MPDTPTPSRRSAFRPCPACAATQALLAEKQIRVVDLETRLTRALSANHALKSRLTEARSALVASRQETAEVRADLDAHIEEGEALLAVLRDRGLLPDDEETDR